MKANRLIGLHRSPSRVKYFRWTDNISFLFSLFRFAFHPPTRDLWLSATWRFQSTNTGFMISAEEKVLGKKWHLISRRFPWMRISATDTTGSRRPFRPRIMGEDCQRTGRRFPWPPVLVKIHQNLIHANHETFFKFRLYYNTKEKVCQVLYEVFLFFISGENHQKVQTKKRFFSIILLYCVILFRCF